MGTLSFAFVVEEVPSGLLIKPLLYLLLLYYFEDWVCVWVWWTCKFESHAPSTSGINMVSL
jgi:hypothetical protein